MIPQGPLLIVGASGRAAAVWAIRNGYEPFVIDLFADEDTQRLCPVLQCPFEQYPHGFIELSLSAPPGPWLYTGGLENAPDVVVAISRLRPLLGNGPGVLHRVRDPFHLQDVCQRFGISFPKTVATLEQIPVHTVNNPGWLKKSTRSSGGFGVSPFDPNEAVQPNSETYYQQVVVGTPMSVLFETNDSRNVKCLGVTRQLIGEDWLHAKPYGYCGNISQRPGPLNDTLQRIGERFTRLWQLRGIWGIDFIERNGEAIVLEINPRITASLEVLDNGSEHIIGKAIYYADHSFAFPETGPWQESLNHCSDVSKRPEYADIPAAGFPVQKGQPVLTILCESATDNEAIHTLKARANNLDKLFITHHEMQS